MCIEGEAALDPFAEPRASVGMTRTIEVNVCNLTLCLLQAEDMFFDPDDMEKFADEGTMEDDLDGELGASALLGIIFKE